MGAAGAAGLENACEQTRVGCGNADVVWQDGHGGGHVVDICPARLTMLVVREFDAEQQFGDRDRGDSGVVVIRDAGADVPSPLDVDEERGVEQ